MQNPVVNVMVKAARAAGNVLLRNMSRLESLNVVEKARQDYASEVDGLAEREIIRELKRAYPDYASSARKPARPARAATPSSSIRSTAPRTTCAASRISASRSPSWTTASRPTR
jgi:3'-phosphoadenosine 5'-phosphosulfate (PAPS) 3'-phosphatase